MENIQKADISAMMHSIEEVARAKAAPGVMVNCVLGAPRLIADIDARAVYGVLETMVDNAARHTLKGSITFGFDDNGDELYFYVKDTGDGVDADRQDELFEPTDGNAGTPLIKAVRQVEAMGGEIGVDSRGAGKGSTFWFTVPYTPLDDAAQAAPEAPAPWSEPQSAAATGPAILIAEDNESNYTLFRSILESRFRIIHARNGQEAVDLYRAHAADVSLVLMDINMPVMDGYEATRAIREISSTVPVVAVTAYAFTTDKQRIYQNGFNAYISKPISINRLERVIADLVG